MVTSERVHAIRYLQWFCLGWMWAWIVHPPFQFASFLVLAVYGSLFGAELIWRDEE